MLPGWTRIEIAGKPVEVLEPPEDRVRGHVLWLHPVRGELPSGNQTLTQAFVRKQLAVCAPWGGETWWSDRICPGFDPALTAEQHIMTHVISWMQSHWQTESSGIAAAGISMGGQGALRFGFKYPDIFRVVASIAGAFDYHERYGQGTTIDRMYPSREACRQDTAILWVNPPKVPEYIWFVCDPTDAEWYRGNDRLQEKLTAIGVTHTADLNTSAGGHTWDYFERMAEPMTDWLAESLTKWKRKLL